VLFLRENKIKQGLLEESIVCRKKYDWPNM